MQSDGSRRMAGGVEPGPRGCLPGGVGKPIKPVMCLALCLMAAGCASIGQALAPAGPARDASIAFESIDGPPRELSQRLIRDLNEEAAALRIAVVPAGRAAAYRMRGYLAAHAQGSTTSIAWAWDVYDAELHRAFRLSGEERAGPAAGRDAGRSPEGRGWAAADEALLRAIARAGMEQLAGFMAAAPAPAAPPAPPPARNGSEVVAGGDDLRGQAVGSFGAEPATEPRSVPLPQRGPAPAGLTGTTRLADAASGR